MCETNFLAPGMRACASKCLVPRYAKLLAGPVEGIANCCRCEGAPAIRASVAGYRYAASRSCLADAR